MERNCSSCKYEKLNWDSDKCIDCNVSTSNWECKDSEEEKPMNKYKREIKPGVEVDIYDVLIAWNVTNPAIQHAIKKLLQPGQRGNKDATQDLQEAMLSIGRAIELENEK